MVPLIQDRHWIAENRVRVVVSSEVPDIYDQKGRMVSRKKRRVFAQFERLVAPQWVRELPVVDTLKMNTRPENQTRENWLCYYSLASDVQRNGWTEEEQKEILERLEQTGDIIEVERPKIAAPWPAYDKLTVQGKRTVLIVAEKIAETVKELEIDPAYVIAYEKQEKNRPEVITALEALGAEEETEDEPLIAA